MSAFINPEATEEVRLPRCYCPGEPHTADTVVIRSQYGYGDLLDLSSVHANLGRIDPMAERAKLLEIGIRSWTFVDEKGPVALSIVNILLLSQEVVEPIAAAIDRAYARSAPPLPNASGARSQPSSRASSSAAKKTRSPKR